MPMALIIEVEKFVSLSLWSFFVSLMNLVLGLSLCAVGSGVHMREVKQLISFFTHERIPFTFI